MENTKLAKEEFLSSNRIFIGQEIRRYRLKKKYNQQCLAVIMGINRATISKIENGKFAISIDYLAKFGWHLDFSVRLFNQEPD